jgi:nucleotide-binding universal stress UspA family protein
MRIGGRSDGEPDGAGHDPGMTHIFDRILCGVDDSAAGATAARLAARVSLPETSLELVSVEDPSAVVHAGMYASQAFADLADAARVALERGTKESAGHPVTTRQLKGPAVPALQAELERLDATLVVVGSHNISRPVGIALGSVATHMLHEARCSVLIAREPRDAFHWPQSIVVGVDGSTESGEANVVARELAERFGAKLRCVVAPDSDADLAAVHNMAPDVEELEGKPVDELTVLSEWADLVAVGSRGLKGPRALGSVSERVAHRANCPVLVVRGA